MQPFGYIRSEDDNSALAARKSAGATYLAGGTSLIDLARLGVENPTTLVDINPLPLAQITTNDESVSIGALVRNSALADHAFVATHMPVLAEALMSGASFQLRNMATVGGNLLQRTRCPYFRNLFPTCNKRQPGTGCGAQEGYNRSEAILGGSAHCIATHPSDMCVALAALEARVHTRSDAGERVIPFEDFHLLPEDHPDRENALFPGELVTRVVIQNQPFFAHSHYVKIRDRASFDFALAAAAAALDVQGGTVRQVRLALGGVATKPWRCRKAEQLLVGKPPAAENFALAAKAELASARPKRHNGFKVELAERAMVAALDGIGKRP